MQSVFQKVSTTICKTLCLLTSPNHVQSSGIPCNDFDPGESVLGDDVDDEKSVVVVPKRLQNGDDIRVKFATVQDRCIV